MKRKSHTLPAALYQSVLCVSALFTLAGCAQSPVTSPQTVAPGGSLSTVAPEFSGPWAAEMKDAYLKSPTAQVQGYLADGKITEAEKQAVTDNFRTCLETKGVKFTDFDPDGGYGFSFEESLGSEAANTIADECSASEGVDTLISLYFQMHRNPENKDQSKEIVACLIRSGVVPNSYTVEDYKSHPITDYAFDREAAIDAASQCTENPTGAFSG